jgi:hypothetical protein
VIASHPDRFIPRDRISGTHCIGGWVDLRAGLDAVEKNFLLPSGIKPLSSIPSPSYYTDWAIQSPYYSIFFLFYNERYTWGIIMAVCCPPVTDWLTRCSWVLEANSHPTSQEIPRFYGTRRLFTVFARARKSEALCNISEQADLFYDKLLAPVPAPMLDDHSLSAICDCVLNIFAFTLYIWRPSSPSIARRRAILW